MEILLLDAPGKWRARSRARHPSHHLALLGRSTIQMHG